MSRVLRIFHVFRVFHVFHVFRHIPSMEHLMNRLFLASFFTTGVLLVSGCTAASGPSFNAYSVDASNGVRTYRAECHGLLESAATCTKVAQHICGDKSVQPIERIDRVREADDNRNDPRVLLFSCAQASDSKTSAEPPSTVDGGARMKTAFTCRIPTSVWESYSSPC